MPRCPGCYRILTHHRLDTHLRWCCAAEGRERERGDCLERLDHELSAVEERIERRIDAVEAELDLRGTEFIDDDTSTRDLTPPST